MSEKDRMFERIETETEAIIKRLGVLWVRISAGGTRCNPCFGMSGPYAARWHNPQSFESRCTGCLLYDLRDLEEQAMPEEDLDKHIGALRQEAESMAHRVDALRRYEEKKFPKPSWPIDVAEMPF